MSDNNLNMIMRSTPQSVHLELKQAVAEGRLKDAAEHTTHLIQLIERGEDDEGVTDWTIPEEWGAIATLVPLLEDLNRVLNFRARVLKKARPEPAKEPYRRACTNCGGTSVVPNNATSEEPATEVICGVCGAVVPSDG